MRISRFHMFMNMAEVAAMRSTCQRGNVAALVTQGNDILAMGYNGPPSGDPHCLGNDCVLSDTGGCSRSIHAEANAISRARLKLKSSLEDCDVYCTYSPCLECAKLIFNAYTNRFFYRYSYRLTDGLEFLLKNSRSMGIYRISPAGYIISERTGRNIAAEDIR